jgi:acyl dehydratase
MALDPKFVGRKYGPYTYKIGLEKMREFAFVVAGGIPSIGFGNPPEGLNPLMWSEEAARQGPHKAVVAFPTFCVTFAIRPFSAAVSDPEIGVNLLMLVHGEQDFEFFDVMKDGDVMTTTGEITEMYAKAGKDFVVVVTESKNQTGKLVVRGTWTAVIRNNG